MMEDTRLEVDRSCAPSLPDFQGPSLSVSEPRNALFGLWKRHSLRRSTHNSSVHSANALYCC